VLTWNFTDYLPLLITSHINQQSKPLKYIRLHEHMLSFNSYAYTSVEDKLKQHVSYT